MSATVHVVTWSTDPGATDGGRVRAFCATPEAVVQMLGRRALAGELIADVKTAEYPLIGVGDELMTAAAPTAPPPGDGERIRILPDLSMRFYPEPAVATYHYPNPETHQPVAQAPTPAAS